MQFTPNGKIGKAVEKSTAPESDTKVFVPKPHKKKDELETDLILGPVPSWSFSSLSKYEQCPRSVAFSRIDKIYEPTSPAAARGTEIHDIAERYVRGEIPTDIPVPLNKFTRGFEALREAYTEGKVTCEENWKFDTHWSVLDPDEKAYWAMFKLDCFYTEGDGSALIIDYKTGKKFGNELKHGEQGLDYAIAAFMRYPELDFVKIEFWYVDKGEKLIREYTRQQALAFRPQLHKRAVIMTTATEFPATPSANACRFCWYGKEGHCKNYFDASNI